MNKLFEWIGGIIGFMCLVQIIVDPKGAIREIERGPMPHFPRIGSTHTSERTRKRSPHVSGEKETVVMPTISNNGSYLTRNGKNDLWE